MASVECESCGAWLEKSGGLVGSEAKCPECGYVQLA